MKRIDRVPTISETLQQAFAHHQAGRFAPAEQGYRQVLEADPRNADAWNGVGVLAQQFGRHELAVQYFNQAISFNPNMGMYFSNMGVALHDMGRFADSVQSHQRALQLSPNDPAAYNNLGIVYRDLGRLNEAMACCQNALKFRPDYAEAHNNLGNVFKDQNRYIDAQRCYERAVEINPVYGPGLNNLGVVYREQGKPIESRVCFDRAYKVEPNDGLKIKSKIVLPIVVDSIDEMLRERDRLHNDMRKLLSEPLSLPDPVLRIGMTVFYTAYHGYDDRELHRLIADVFKKATPSLSCVAPHCTPGHVRKPGRIRVGFISKFFHEHTMGKLNLGFLRHLSREKFEVTLFRFPGNDDSWCEQLSRAADRAIVLSPKIDQARQQIAACELDILHYPDIGMDPMSYCIAFARLAPAQTVSWGHPVTSGIPTIDYFISSVDLEPPGAESHYTEKLVRLPHPPTYYYAPARTGTPRTRADFKLPEDKHLYVCPQSLFKMHPEFDTVLKRILEADPQGLVVLIEGQQEHWTELLMKRYRRTMPSVADRVAWVSRQGVGGFIDLLALADCILDPLHFSGGNTTFEAFSVGTPIVTLPGEYMRARVTAAFYRQMGLLDFIARDHDHYVELAVRLGTDRAFHDEAQRKIVAARPALYENIAVVRELEAVFEAMATGQPIPEPKPAG